MTDDLKQKNDTKKIVLTGIKPTGSPHIGNLLGAIQPALDMAKEQQDEYQALYFIADYHALTAVKDREALQAQVYEVAATWLAAGLDPEKVIFYRQSDVPEIFELNWILSCFSPKGLLNRAHSYKASMDVNTEKGWDVDKGVNMGLYNYPVLMSADILMFGSHSVPVGQDQKQHLEIARDIAQAFNQTYKSKLFTLPEPIIQEGVKTIPGLDGRKMSKSYDNVIPLYQSPKKLKNRINQIVTDSKEMEEVKDPDACNVFALYKLFSTKEEQQTLRETYLAGGMGYGHAKGELFKKIDAFVAPGRETYEKYMNDTAALDEILAAGAVKARAIATPFLQKVRQAIGIGK